MNTFIISVKDSFEEKALLSFSKSMGLKITKAGASSKADYSMPGKPLTKKQYQTRLQEARNMVADGNSTTQEDLENEARQW